MKQKIRFKGLSLTPDEQAVDNGALAMSVGVELHNGSLRPSIVEGSTVTNVDGDIIYIHEISESVKNVAFVKDSTLYYQSMSEGATPTAFEGSIDVSTVTSMVSNGNTLMMLTTDGLRYFLWSDDSYKYLGERPPMIKLEFNMAVGSTIIKDVVEDNGMTWKIQRNSAPNYYRDSANTWDEATEDSLTTMEKLAVLGRAYVCFVADTDYSERDKLVTREDGNDAALGQLGNALAKAGYMYMPFYVRYCYKLWDGRKIMHSAPVLMFTEITYPECVFVWQIGHHQIHQAALLAAKLRYKCLNPEVYTELKTTWKYIVRSIDIYVTPGISRYDETTTVNIYTGDEEKTYPEEGKWHKLKYSATKSSNSYFRAKYEWDKGKMQWADKSITDKSCLTMDHMFEVSINGSDWTQSEDPSTTDLFYHGVFTLNPLGDGEWRKRLLKQNTYYLLSRFTIQEDDAPLSTEADVHIEKGVLANLESQEAMISESSPDDYYTHNGIIAEASYMYNSRINLTKITDVLFEGFPLNLLAMGDAAYSWEETNGLDILQCRQMPGGTTTTSVYDAIVSINAITVGIKTDYGMKYVKTTFTDKSISLYELASTFIFYPDSRAREIWFTGKALASGIYFDLQEHPMLNGAYHLGNAGSLSSSLYTDMSLPESIVYDNKLSNKSYIYTSASGNPFVFPAANRYKIGLGEVLALTSVTRAISQGQFGQFPLMAFASDGIYALEVSSTGSYSSVHPISREVTTNTEALLQLDQSVAFITKRGASQIVSSDVAGLTDMLNGVVPDLESMLSFSNDILHGMTDEAKNPIQALQVSKAIYDYSNKRLLYFIKKNGEFTGEVLIFSADDASWTYAIASASVKNVFCSYPYPYVHNGNGDLTILDTPYDYTKEGTHDGLVITRTLKYDGVRNFISGFLQDYDFDEAKPDIYFWGSNDNRRWHYIGHSKRRQQTRVPGHTYKYFRAAVVFEDMKVDDLYHGIELDIKEKYTR